MDKHSKISSCTNWRLGENVVVTQMECLTRTAKFDIFITILHLPADPGVNNIRATGVLSNTNGLSLGTNSCKKRHLATLNSARQASK